MLTSGALLIVMTVVLGLGTAATASAATTCRDYNSFVTDGGTPHAATVCAAPASDYPTYSGWGRVVTTYSTVPNDCEPSLFPLDRPVLAPQQPCPLRPLRQVVAYRWTAAGWREVGLGPMQRAYFAPYTTGWVWAWTADNGWLALADAHAAYRWCG